MSPGRSLRVVIALIVAAGLFQFAISRPAARARVYDDAGCGDVGTPAGELRTKPAKAMVLCLLNHERTQHGLPPLRRKAALERASDAHSDDLAARHYFAHETPEGKTPNDRMAAAGYTARPGGMTGENIGWGQEEGGSPSAIMDGWMHSPGHRANILRPEFSEVGVGIEWRSVRRADPRDAGIYTTDFGG
jgi:uncharacterized protein YkwD